MNQKFKEIVKLFQKLPGVGPRQAARFVLALLEKPQPELIELGRAITELKQTIHFCQECFNVSENSHCTLCSNPKRDTTKVMVVEKVTDLASFERAGIYKGLYHVLGGAIDPMGGTGPEKLKITELEVRLDRLVKPNQPVELIIATNPSTAGETTTLYLRDRLARKKGVVITHLARGLASGSNLEYADETTLKHALEQRK